jgi:hypothetical protein
MSWLRIPDSSGDSIVFCIGFVFLAATFWEWKKGYSSVKGHFETSFLWKGSLAIRFIFSGIIIMSVFLTVDCQEIINRSLVQTIGYIVIGCIGVVMLISAVLVQLKQRRR